jgi:hypothetical protein
MARVSAYGALATAAGGGLERSTLRFEWLGLPRGAGALVVAAGAAVVVALLFGLYRRERAGRARWFGLALRMAVVAAVAVVLFRPAVAHDAERVLPGRVAVLIDDSASMSVRDEAAVEEQAPPGGGRQGAGGDEASRLSRHDVARALVEAEDGWFLTALAARNRVELKAFAEDSHEVLTLDRGAAAPAVRARPATGRETNLAAVLAAELATARPPAAIVVLTDGRDTSGADLGAVALEAAQAGVPLHFVGLGAPGVARNVTVSRLFSDDRGLKGQPLDMRALVRSQGYEGERAELVLSVSWDGDAGRAEVLRRGFVLHDGRGIAVDVGHVPDSAGVASYSARVLPMEGEDNPDDNEGVRVVTVAERQTRVLLVAGGPSREYRFLSALLGRTPGFEVTALPGGAAFGEAPDSGDYDVVVLCDPSAEAAPAGWVEQVAASVNEGLQGLVFIAGPAHTPEVVLSPAQEVLRRVLPVRFEASDVRGLIGGGGYFTEPLDVALAVTTEHPIVRVARDGGTAGFWDSVPPLYWVLPTSGLKGGAVALLRCTGPRGGAPGGGAVLVAVQPYGLGRSLYCGSPETWRWRRAGAAHYERFWLNAVRYCAPLQPGARRDVAIMLERSQYEFGEVVPVRVLVRRGARRDGADEPLTLQLLQEGRPPSALVLRPTGRDGGYEGAFTPAGFGRVVLAYADADGGAVTEALLVEEPALEFEDVSPATHQMQVAARTTGGRYVRPEEAHVLPGVVPDGSRTVVEYGPLEPAWDKLCVLVLLLAGLTSEWILRRRLGMA